MKPARLLQMLVMAQRFESLAMELYGLLAMTLDGKRWVFAVEGTAISWKSLLQKKQRQGLTPRSTR